LKEGGGFLFSLHRGQFDLAVFFSGELCGIFPGDVSFFMAERGGWLFFSLAERLFFGGGGARPFCPRDGAAGLFVFGWPGGAGPPFFVSMAGDSAQDLFLSLS